MTTKTLAVVGVNFRTAPAHVREVAVRLEEEVLNLFDEARESHREMEMVALNTCNRNEIYVAAPPFFVTEALIERWVRSLGDDRYYYRLDDEDAARHLFRVTCGLDSAVLGDGQIAGQVRRAMALASERGTLGRHLQETFRLALEASAKARQDTGIGHGAATIGSALVRILARRLAEYGVGSPCEILTLGGGEMARDIGRNIQSSGIGRVTFVNRTEDKAVSLAREFGGASAPWNRLEEIASSVDVIIAATAAPKPVLDRSALERLSSRSSRLQLVADLGVPRNVEPAGFVPLIDIDAVRDTCSSTERERRAAEPEVRRIVRDALKSWKNWNAFQPIETRLKQLYQAAIGVSRSAGDELAAMERVDSETAERIVLKSIKKVLHEHVRDLRRDEA